jgi:hypothetical protein
LPCCKKVTSLEGFCNADGFKISVKPASGPAERSVVGNALYGLQSTSSDVRKVEDVLAALAPKIRELNAVRCQSD